MRSDMVPGAIFRDYELSDYTAKPTRAWTVTAFTAGGIANGGRYSRPTGDRVREGGLEGRACTIRAETTPTASAAFRPAPSAATPDATRAPMSPADIICKHERKDDRHITTHHTGWQILTSCLVQRSPAAESVLSPFGALGRRSAPSK